MVGIVSPTMTVGLDAVMVSGAGSTVTVPAT
jgi:hypothetical protein